MIAELGHFALALALLVALVQATVPFLGAARGDPGWMAVGGSAALVQLALVALAMTALMHAYVVSDFSLANVVANSHSAKPLLYRIAGVWGNHEGSMLLWVLMLALCSAALALFSGNLPAELRARVLAVQGMIATAFLLFILLTSNPFLRVWPPAADGNGLNPVLQDPGLAFHPPFLYLGYVGFSVGFSFAVAALVDGRVDAAWARWVRPWTLASWCFLTIGIAMGSWWAYYTLGWGGWWYWDPVENASFMPWLAGTALIHSAIVVERRNALKSWTILLAILTFSLSLIGTFLVRSGVLTSVHAFATDPRRGAFILLMLLVAIGGSLALFAARAPALRDDGVFAPVSREGALLLNNLLLASGCATVFLGTLYPLFLDALGGPKLSVGAPFFTSTFVPIMVPMVIAVGLGPLLAWKRGDLAGALQRLWIAFGAAGLAGLVAWRLAGGGPVGGILGLALAAWTGAAVLAELAERLQLFRAPPRSSLARARHMPRAAWGTSLAHLGLAVSVAGFSASAFDREALEVVRPGGEIALAGHVLRLDGVRPLAGPNYEARQGTVAVLRDGREIGRLTPEQRYFPLHRQTTSVTAIRTNLLADLYVALGDPDPDGGWTLRVYWKPLVPWIWIGAVMMAGGGIVSLSDRRWRVGAVARRRTAAAAPAGTSDAGAVP